MNAINEQYFVRFVHTVNVFFGVTAVNKPNTLTNGNFINEGKNRERTEISVIS